MKPTSEVCARCGHEDHGDNECNVPEGFPDIYGEESLCKCPAFVPAPEPKVKP